MRELNTAVVHELWERLKLVEKRLGQWDRAAAALNSPALNELRYSLVFLLKYLCDESGPQNLENSLKHAKLAHFKCLETEAIFYFQEFIEFEKAFEQIDLLERLPDFLDWSSRFNTLRELMGNMPEEEREQSCELLEAQLIKLRPIHKRLAAARIELLKSLRDREEETHRLREDLKIKKKQLYIAAIGAIIMGISLVVTLIIKNAPS